MRIPVAGMGAVCGAGRGVRAGFGAVAQGRDGVAPLSVFESGLKQAPLCAQIRGRLDLPGGFVAANKTTAMAILAADEALENFPDRKNVRLGVVSATTIAGITRSELFYQNYLADSSTISLASRELAAHEPTAMSGSLCDFVKGQGFHTISTACSTGLHAIGMARRLIERGVYDACVAVGSDALSVLTVRGFASLTLLDPSGCRPFDTNRAGISLGEGAGAVLLVHPKLIDKCISGALAWVSGWGASSDCHHMTAPHPEGAGAKAAVAAALDEARLAPGDIGLIVTHGTGTPDNDKAEIKGMQALFPVLPPFCSMKRTLGHTLAASGILEAVFAVCALRENIIPSTAGFEAMDHDIGAAPSPGQTLAVEHVLKNSFGFGGNNAAVLFSRSSQ